MPMRQVPDGVVPHSAPMSRSSGLSADFGRPARAQPSAGLGHRTGQQAVRDRRGGVLPVTTHYWRTW
jgi:hypothetical protein